MPPITPEDYRRLESAFDELLDLAADEREGWLAAYPEERPGDRDLLRGLLDAHLEQGDRLSRPLPEEAARLVAEGLGDPLLGVTLGAFRVVEEIGRGGMGVVYRGVRAAGDFEQDVVIKVLRVGIDSESTRARFLQERAILAKLDHPAIVRVHDGGFTPDGRPYIVMNLVAGRRIDEYCDGMKLGVEARVRLFLGVIESVDHAHRHLVIHRDLKPSNVRVDGNGKVHLLDFGIAKILHEDDAGGLTRTRHRVMTPEYASPEQFRQEDITTASDVYQLGILLYQLLTGLLPYGPAVDNPREVEKRVCESDPVPASRAVTRSTAAGSAVPDANGIFANRSITPARLRRKLSGDLDLILLKALRKEPERRYSTANGLRSDLIRWLSGDRIMARPDSFGYQLRRFARRNRVLLALAATVLVVSAGFTVYHVRTITEERDLARQEAARRREVSDFLVDLLKVPDPTAAEGREVTARELLEGALPGIRNDLTDPLTKLRLLDVVADVARNLGQLDRAQAARRDQVALSTEIHGRRSAETARALQDLSALLRGSREFEAAAGPAEEALDIRRAIHPAGSLEIASALEEVALVHRDLGRTDEAEAELREANGIYARLLPPDDRIRIATGADLAYVLRKAGKMEEAEALYRETIPAMRERSGEFKEALANALNNLAYLLRLKEEYEEAEALYREAIAVNETHFGDAHPSTLNFRNNLASVLNSEGKVEQAREQLEMAIPLTIRLHGVDHWRVGRAHRTLGVFLFMNGRYGEAAKAFAESVRIFAAGLGDDALWTAVARAFEATALRFAGDETGAEALWERAARRLDAPDARADGETRGMLTLLRDRVPDRDGPWTARVEALIAGE